MNKQMLRIVVLVIFGVFLTTHKSHAQVPAASHDVMLQAFYWDSFSDSKWTTLESQSTELSQYYDMLWLPPSANSTGWMGYMPIDWLDQSSPFGTPTELKSLIATLKTKGTKCIADIVVNHRNGESDWCNFPDFTYKGTTYKMGLNTICNNDDGGYTKKQGTTSSGQPCDTYGVIPQTDCVNQLYNITGANDTGDDFGGSRDIDHTSIDTQNAIKAYLDFMKNEMGYAGWRYDMVKGYNGSYNEIYNNSASNYFSVGEYWDGSYDALWAWINATGKTSTAFDFSFKYRLNEAYAANDLTKINWAGQPAGLISNGTSKRYSTTFIDNHDTYRDGSKFTGDVLQANAWMLSMPGIPCVFLTHWQQNKSAIKAMIEARRAVGIHSESDVTITNSAWDLAVATVTGTNGTLVVKIGNGSYSGPGGTYTLATSGNGYAIWINPTGSVTPVVTISPSSGYYAGGTSVTLTSKYGAAPVKIYYTTDGSTPSASSNLYSVPFSVTVDNTTVKAIAIDNGSVASAVVSATYTTTAPTNITVKFKAPASWTTVKVWAWMGTGTPNITGGVWPGQLLTPESGIVTFTTPITNSGFNILFNNSGNNEQTVDILNVTSDVCYETTTSTGTAPKKYSVVLVPGCWATSFNSTAAKASIIVYPNPATESFILESDLNLSLVQIYSISGELVKSIPVTSNQEVIEIQDLPSGFYSVVAVTEEGVRSTTKLIKK